MVICVDEERVVEICSLLCGKPTYPISPAPPQQHWMCFPLEN